MLKPRNRKITKWGVFFWFGLVGCPSLYLLREWRDKQPNWTGMILAAMVLAWLVYELIRYLREADA
jgi:hypothetical protein